MQQNRYKLWERLLSILVFVLSTTVYIITMEKSATVWDNPEFITTFYKLEVGHPPGAPFYMLVYNFFSHFFPGHGDWIAISANALSGVFSGLTILLLFRTIAHLIRRGEELSPDRSISRTSGILALGGALVGSLLYAFTDTFWYSAVEAEVYSFSSFFTALVFYLMLKWEESSGDRYADRWLLVIMYLMGLSVGVHLLNLLAIPAMALIYYFKKYDHPTWRGGIIAVLVSFALIAVMMFGVIQGAPEVAGWFDLFFVNTLGFGFNSGLFVYVLLLITTLGLTFYATMRRPVPQTLMRVGFFISVILIGIPFMGNGWIIPLLIIGGLGYYLFVRKRQDLHTIGISSLSLLLFFIGLSTYGVILIRANSNIPMNQNTPSDVFSLKYYLSREQYGSTPLIYGQTYASLPEYDSNGRALTKTSTVYKRAEKLSPEDPDRYEATDTHTIIYRKDMNMLFPRVYSTLMPHYKDGYMMWGDVEGETRTIMDRGQARTVQVPTFAENLRYFFSYQVNYMYWRYFLWNFSGRQNDIQGQGEITKGNWISGIPFIDGIFLGPQDNLPSFIKDNPGHNRYYMLPLILGLLGLLMQVFGATRRSMQNFWIVLALFFMTGLAIVLYLNQPPYQVRERDYAYAGSFYAFAIWIGFGVPALYNLLTKNGTRHKPLLAGVVTAVSMLLPVLVLAENWDDHDRHGRRLAADSGNNYLESCEPNGIIFCNGDNDTFPLWYAQEVEGVRPDLRVCNTSYLQADWYISQMKQEVYGSAPLPITWGLKEYGGDKRGIAYIMPQVSDSIPVRLALDFVGSDDPKLKQIPGIAQQVDYMPAERLYIDYNPHQLISSGALYAADTAYISEPKMKFDFKGKNYLGKQELIILDMIETNKFERPVYYCITVGSGEHVGMTDNFRQTGMAYQVLPFVTKGTTADIDTKRMYENVMTKYKWGGADKKGVYMDDNNRKMVETYRSMVFGKLAQALIREGDIARAKEVLALSETAIRADVVPHGASSLGLIQAYYDVKDKSAAENIATQILDENIDALQWYFRLNTHQFILNMSDIEARIVVASEVLRLDKANGGSLATKYEEELRKYQEGYFQTYKRLNQDL